MDIIPGASVWRGQTLGLKGFKYHIEARVADQVMVAVVKLNNYASREYRLCELGDRWKPQDQVAWVVSIQEMGFGSVRLNAIEARLDEDEGDGEFFLFLTFEIDWKDAIQFDSKQSIYVKRVGK